MSYDLGAGLLCCDITAGTHTVEYRYRPPGLLLGGTISVLAVCILIFLIYHKKKLPL